MELVCRIGRARNDKRWTRQLREPGSAVKRQGQLCIPIGFGFCLFSRVTVAPVRSQHPRDMTRAVSNTALDVFAQVCSATRVCTGEHQTAYARRMVVRELLGDSSTRRMTKNETGRNVEQIEQVFDVGRQLCDVVRGR